VSAKVIVVGAGAIGAATALRLVHAGARVTVVEADGPGTGTSATTFAWIGASSRGLRPYFDLNVAGVTAHRRLRAELGPRPWYHPTGSLVWHTDPAQAADIVANVGELREAGYAATLLTPERALAIEPSLRIAPEVDHVAFHPDEGYADAREMAADLTRLAQDEGARLRCGADVVGIDEDASGVVVVLADGDRLEADLVVLCGGRHTGALAGLAGTAIPMIDTAERGSYMIGLLVTTTVLPEPVGRVVIADDRMIRPGGDGRLLLHTDEHDRLVEPAGGEEHVAEIARQVVEATRPYVAMPPDAAVERSVVGLRALTADMLPAVGWVPGSNRVYAAVTHSGITIAPALGELVASEVAGGAEEPLLAPFRPGRFATTTLTRRPTDE
jgi:glycine/D-amino acid oxidase-like deaminating enzyme